MNSEKQQELVKQATVKVDGRMNEVIFSRCVYDVDHRYVDIEISSPYVDTYTITVSDTSSDEQSDQEIQFQLTRSELQTVIDRLTKALG